MQHLSVFFLVDVKKRRFLTHDSTALVMKDGDLQKSTLKDRKWNPVRKITKRFRDTLEGERIQTPQRERQQRKYRN